MFIYSQSQVEEEDEADDGLILIGLRVKSGDERPNVDGSLTITTSSWDNFPNPRTALSPESKHVVLCPDSCLGSLYTDDRVEVTHDVSDMARYLLDSNYLPPVLFGRDADFDIRKRVFEAFDLTDRGVQDDNTEYENDLREMAGMDSIDTEEVVQKSEAEKLKQKYKYTELQSMAKERGIDDARTDKDTLAEYIVSNPETDDEEDSEE